MHVLVCFFYYYTNLLLLPVSKAHYLIKLMFAVYTLANAFGLVDEDLPSIARQGSGSACRSIYGGFVRWNAGIDDLGSDSTAVQIAADTHWPDMRILILVVNIFLELFFS